MNVMMGILQWILMMLLIFASIWYPFNFDLYILMYRIYINSCHHKLFPQRGIAITTVTTMKKPLFYIFDFIIIIMLCVSTDEFLLFCNCCWRCCMYVHSHIFKHLYKFMLMHKIIQTRDRDKRGCCTKQWDCCIFFVFHYFLCVPPVTYIIHASWRVSITLVYNYWI